MIPAALATWLLRTRETIDGDRLNVPDNRGTLIFRDYGADVLLVAHVDHVGEPVASPIRVSGTRVAHVGLDDRLGCYAIEELVRRGVKADLLFTDCEETGQTTGADFVAPREYRFILSMDRAGVDCVLYQYDDHKAWRKFCGRHIGPHALGSVSCIDSMAHLSCCGINVGVGYFEHNGPRCWADVRLTMAQLARTESFIVRARRKRWEYAPVVYADGNSRADWTTARWDAPRCQFDDGNRFGMVNARDPFDRDYGEGWERFDERDQAEIDERAACPSELDADGLRRLINWTLRRQKGRV